jgi:hypothetical protein
LHIAADAASYRIFGNPGRDAFRAPGAVAKKTFVPFVGWRLPAVVSPEAANVPRR